MNKSYYQAIVALSITLLAIEYFAGGHLHVGFYSWFGFASCVGLVFIALAIGRIIKRKDTYYD